MSTKHVIYADYEIIDNNGDLFKSIPIKILFNYYRGDDGRDFYSKSLGTWLPPDSAEVDFISAQTVDENGNWITATYDMQCWAKLSWKRMPMTLWMKSNAKCYLNNTLTSD